MKSYVGDTQLILNCEKLLNRSRKNNKFVQKNSSYGGYRSLKKYIALNEKQYLNKKYLIHNRAFSLQISNQTPLKKVQIHFENPKKKRNSQLMKKPSRCNSTDTSISVQDRHTRSLNLSPKKPTQYQNHHTDALNRSIYELAHAQNHLYTVNKIRGLKAGRNLLGSGANQSQERYQGLCVLGSRIL